MKKLTAAEVKRLLALQAKAASELNDAEKAELTDLKTRAAAAKDDDEMSSDDLKSIVETTVKAALPAGATVTEAQVKSIVEAAVKGITPASVDLEGLAAKVKAAMPTTITTDDVKGIVETALKGIRKESKMVHDSPEGGLDPSIEFPIAHKSGNLSVDAKQLLNIMTGKAMNDGIPETVLRDAERRGEASEKRILGRLRQGGVAAQKTITAGGAGTGQEFMNSTISSTLLARMYMESALAAALTASEVQMPSNPFTYPLSTSRPTFYTGAETVAGTASDPGTDKLVLNAKKLIGRVDYSYEADEDSVIAILPTILQQLGAAAADALEGAIINGDTAGTHQDSDIAGVTNHASKLFDGIRKLTLAQSALKLSLASGGISAANVGAMRKLLKRWGLNPKDLLLVLGVNGYNDAVMLPETLTAEKAGSQSTARILTGMAPNILGIDIIASAQIREDLNASGVYDGSVTTKGSLLLLHKPSWITGVKRGFTLESFRDIKTQTSAVVASFRRDFKPIESLANTKAAVLGYNYTA